jgi:AraC-like DNA-binding protein
METKWEIEPLRARLVAAILPFAPTAGAFATAIDGLSLYRRVAPTMLTPCFYEPALTVVAQGAKTVILGRQRFVYDQAHCLLTSVDLPATSQVTLASAAKPYLAVSLRLDLPLAGEMLAATARTTRAGPAGAALTADEISVPLLEAMIRLVGLLASPADVPVLRPLIEREILYRLMTGRQGARLVQLVSADSRLQRVARAIAWLKRHYADPCRVQDLADQVGMSVSALHHQFKVATAQSPVQFQKQLRLQQARRLMLSGADAATAGYEVGYESPSHFSRDYRRLFGAAPMQDVTALRQRA